MDRKEFVDNTILQLNKDLFIELRNFLIEEKYVSFLFFNDDNISKELLAEKLCDYFEKVEISTFKSFDRILDKYISNLDYVVSGKIAKTPKQKKKEPTPDVPRARKFYEKITSNKKQLNIQSVIDYTRIMLCLYSAIIENDYKEIDDFDYSFCSINIGKIIDSLKCEHAGLKKSPKFDISKPYDTDRCTFIILISVYYYMKSQEVVGEYNV